MNSLDKIKLLLDSTYLLPIVGVEVEGTKRVLMLLKKLRSLGILEIYYTPFNIIEILGKISKMKYDPSIVSMGLKLIKEEFRQTQPTIDGYTKALKLKTKGFRDLIDLLLYTTSLTQNIEFLTRDKTLINFLKENKEDIKNIIYEEDFIKQYNNL